MDKQDNWMHWSTQNKMLKLMANNILRQVLEDDIFAVMSDEISDESRKKQLVILFRHVENNLEVCECARLACYGEM